MHDTPSGAEEYSRRQVLRLGGVLGSAALVGPRLLLGGTAAPAAIRAMPPRTTRHEAGAHAVGARVATAGFGAYLPGWGDWASNIATMEAGTGRRLDLAMDYADWPTGTASLPTPPFLAALGGRPLMWTVQPAGQNTYRQAPPDNVVDWDRLIAGAYDSQLVAFSRWVNACYHHEALYVRFAHEMNGTGWYEWQVGGACGVRSPAHYAAGFDHVAAVLKAHSSRIKMVYAVNNGYSNVAAYYPARADILAVDGYNDVGSPSWMSPAQVLDNTYRQLAALDPAKPIWVAETACQEPSAPWSFGGQHLAARPWEDKGLWVRNFFDNTTHWPRLGMVVWFNKAKERNWVWDSSASSAAAFRSVMSGLSGGSPRWDPSKGGLRR